MIDGINTAYVPPPRTAETDDPNAAKTGQGVQAPGPMPPAGQATPPAMTAADLAPASGQSPGSQPSAALPRLEGALAWLTSGGSDIARALIRIIIEQAASERKDALDQRLAAHETVRQQQLEKASKENEAADKMDSGAGWALAANTVGCALSAYGACESLGESAEQMRQLNALDAKSPTFQAQLNVANAHGSIGQAENSRWSAAGTALSGYGQYASTTSQADAKRAEAEGAVAEAESQSAQQKGDTAKEAYQGLEDMIAQMIRLAADLGDAKAEAMKSLTRLA